MSNPFFLRTAAAAQHLGLSSGTLEKMRLRGDGPRYLRLSPRRIVYEIDTLNSWARSREYRSTSDYPSPALPRTVS
jgi:hypothetical protein